MKAKFNSSKFRSLRALRKAWDRHGKLVAVRKAAR